jgi:hypothetical protein
MLRLLSIDLVGVDRIHVSAHTQQLIRFSPREDWDGTYRRVKGGAVGAPNAFFPIVASEALGTLTRPDGSKHDFFAQDIEGDYQGTGITLNLAGGLYNLTEKSISRRGRYHFFKYGENLILDLEPYEAATDVGGRRTYILLTQGGPEDKVVAMKLRQAQIRSQSVIPLYRPDIELERSDIQGIK